MNWVGDLSGKASPWWEEGMLHLRGPDNLVPPPILLPRRPLGETTVPAGGAVTHALTQGLTSGSTSTWLRAGACVCTAVTVRACTSPFLIPTSLRHEGSQPHDTRGYWAPRRGSVAWGTDRGCRQGQEKEKRLYRRPEMSPQLQPTSPPGALTPSPGHRWTCSGPRPCLGPLPAQLPRPTCLALTK